MKDDIATGPSGIPQTFGKNNEFKLGDLLGAGASANVYKCTHLETGEVFAVKVVDLNQARLHGKNIAHEVKRLRAEVELLRSLPHQNIVKLVQLYEIQNKFIFLVLEYVPLGELFQWVSDKSVRPTEIEAKFIFCQLVDAVSFMHARNVLHRDLKAENVLVSRREISPPDGQPPVPGIQWYFDIRIADFGLSKYIREGLSKAQTFVGTPQYWAPEVIRTGEVGGYDERADWWSVGTLLYVILGCRYPFNNDNEVLHAKLKFGKNFDRVSDDAKDLITKLMKKNRNERISLVDALFHPWLKDFAPAKRLLAVWDARQSAMVTDTTEPVQLTDEELMGAVSDDEGTSRPARIQMAESAEFPDSTSQLLKTTTSRYSPQMQMRNSARSGPILRNHESIEIVMGGGSQPEIESTPVQEVGFFLPEPGKASKTEDGGQTVGVEQVDSRLSSKERTSVEGKKKRHEAVESLVGNEFELEELTKSQVVIAQAFHHALLAFRHDPKMAPLIQNLSNEARRVQDLSIKAVQKYAHTAAQVVQLLPDVCEGVQAGMPEESIELISEVRTWLSELQGKGVEVQEAYTTLITQIQDAVQGAQNLKRHKDLSLAYSFREGFETSVNQLRLEDRIVDTILEEGEEDEDEKEGQAGDDHGEGEDGEVNKEDESPAEENLSEETDEDLPYGHASRVGKKNDSTLSLPKAGASSSTPSKSGPQPRNNALLNMLFDRLTKYVEPQGTSDTTFDELLEVAFMCPGYVPTRDKARKKAASSLNLEADAPNVVNEVEEVPTIPPSSQGLEVVAREPSLGQRPNMQQQTDAMGTKYLVSTLNELRKVEHILRKSRVFWEHVDECVSRLEKYKEHTSRLLRMAAKSDRMFARFKERMDDYVEFWDSLGDLCGAYAKRVRAQTENVYENLLAVRHKIDIMDTALSLRGNDLCLA